MAPRVVPLSLALKMCKCGRLKLKEGWRMIRSPLFDFIRQVTGEDIRTITIKQEVCTTCRPR